MGSTLTLTQNSATLLIAFIALYSALITSHVWKIICFGVHMYYSTAKSQDIIHHQRQAILRNNSGAASSFSALVQVWWAWRRVGQSRWKLIPLLVCAFLSAALLGLASGFSSKVASGNEVLLSGANCGMSTYPGNGDFDTEVQVFNPYVAGIASASAIQATNCYSNESMATLGCEVLVKPRLGSVVDRNATCPFRDLCRNQYGNLQIDSGLMNSHDDLGMNAPPTERLYFRILQQCAPLKAEGYRALVNVSPDMSYTQYYYGKTPANNHTYVVSNNEIYESQVTNRTGETPEYKLK